MVVSDKDLITFIEIASDGTLGIWDIVHPVCDSHSILSSGIAVY
jgi:hypothetical protein